MAKSIFDRFFGPDENEPLPPLGERDELIKDESVEGFRQRITDKTGRSDTGIIGHIREREETGDPVEGLSKPGTSDTNAPQMDAKSLQMFNQYYNNPQEGRITDIKFGEAEAPILPADMTGQDFLGSEEQYQQSPVKQMTGQEFLGPQQLYDADSLHGNYWDNFFSLPNGPGRIMDLFNKEYNRAFGDEGLGTDRAEISQTKDEVGKIHSKTVTQWLKDIGMIADVDKANGNWIRQLNESLLRGTAALADYSMRAAYATARGAAATAVAPGLTAAITAPIGAAVSGEFESMTATMGLHTPEGPAGQILHPDAIDTAINLGTLKRPPTEAEATAALVPTGRNTGTEIVLPERPTPEVTVAGDNANARAFAKDPETFSTLGDLLGQQSVLRGWLKQAMEPQSFDVGGVEVPASTPLVDVAAAAGRAEEAPTARKSAQASMVEQIRKELDAVDEKIRDLHPAIREAYKDEPERAPISYEVTPETVDAAESIPAVDTFQTARGSIYEVHEDGTTTRDKSYHPEHGTEDVGLKPQSSRTIYVDSALDATSLSGAGLTDPGGAGYRVILGEGKAVRIWKSHPDRDWGTSDASNNISFTTTPEVGKFPVELFNPTEDGPGGYKGQHAGNEIVDVKPRTINTLTQRRPTINQTVRDQLIAAGRPEEEARAAAAVQAAYYTTKAARFEGALGSARDIFDREAPEIVPGKGRAGVGGLYNFADHTIQILKTANAGTAIHEFAHTWFEELLKDAQHPQAPAELIEDVKTIKDWLGQKDERPTKGQHEQFARGFERFMREGVAPSPRLATVFAKFADWLRTLYRSVSQLSAPLTPEMRGVYSRLLDGAPEEAIIAPERPVDLNFADVHERDVAALTARATDRESIIPTAENIRAERDTIAATLRAEIEAARLRVRAASRARRTAAQGGPSGSAVSGSAERGGLQPESVREVTGTEPAKISPSGANFKAEPETGVSPDARLTDRPDTRLVDSSGNIRIDNISSPDEIETAIRQSGEYVGGQRREVVTDGEMIDLAISLGRDPAFLDRNAVRGLWTSREILSARLLLRQSEAEIRAAAQTALEGGDQVQLAKVWARNQMIQGKIIDARAEWGRAGRAFQQLDRITTPEGLETFLKANKADFGLNYDQLMQAAKYGVKLDAPGQLNGFVSNTHGAKSPIVLYYYNSLLSGEITHAIYVAGNELKAIWEPGLAIPAGVAVRQIARAFGREARPGDITMAEAKAALFALGKGHSDGWRAMKEAWDTGQQVILPGQTGYQGPFGMYMAPEAGRVARVINTPYRSVAAIHSLGVTVRYTQNLARYSLRQALSEGLTGDALAQRVAQLRADPPDHMLEAMYNPSGRIMGDLPPEWEMRAELMKKASDEAMKTMYMRPLDYNSNAAAALRLLHSNLFTQVMVPFAKVGIEIQRQTFLEHTPLGFANKAIRADATSGDYATRDEALGRMGVGMTMLGGGFFFSALGLTNGYGPSQKELRPAWLGNNTPYSIKIGPFQIPMQGFPVIGNLMMFGADMYETAHYWDGQKLHDLIGGYLKAFTRVPLSEGLFTDAAALGELINDPGANLSKFLLNWAPGWVYPSSFLRQTNRYLFDPYSKDIHGFDVTAGFDAVRSIVPFASWGVPNRIDPFGNPILSRGANPISQMREQDPVAKMLQDLHVPLAPVERSIKHNNASVDLTTRQYEHYATVAGKAVHKALLPYVTNPRFQQLTEGQRRVAIHEVVSKYRKVAEQEIIQESIKNNPRDNIITQANKKREEMLK